MTRFNTVSPIGPTDPSRLPVKDIGPAVGYYVHVLGFTLKERAENAAILIRDEATIGLAVSSEDPEQASVYFGVSDVEALRRNSMQKASNRHRSVWTSTTAAATACSSPKNPTASASASARRSEVRDPAATLL
jgi:predicted enzyme related to lactoylglutathione lyase